LNKKEQKLKKLCNKLLKNFNKLKELILLKKKNIKKHRKPLNLPLKIMSKLTKKKKQLMLK